MEAASASLSVEQATFLTRHKIPLDQVFDASGMTQSQYRPPMSATKKLIALGIAPCKSGHTMRMRSGNCPECNPAFISYQRRHSTRGVVYVAGSRASKLIKIGSTGDLSKREIDLNSQRYASQTDWTMLAHIATNNAGAVEFKIQDLLSRYQQITQHFREGQIKETREVFACGYPIARYAVIRVLSPADLAKLWEKPGAGTLYSFMK